MPPSQPFLYAAPSQTSVQDPWGAGAFDPKAYSRASWVPRPTPSPKPKGPLIDFNRHPDSYLSIPYGRTNVTPLPSAFKSVVVSTRWLQFLQRFLGFLGAVGTLICVVCLKNVQDTESLIIRIPPAVDVLVMGYAVWHLARPARQRTPGSSASYHLFASILDVCMIPFYVYIALDDRARIAEPVSAKDRWGSRLSADATEKLFHATWILAISTAALHAGGLIVSVFLAMAFRKITDMPPDMNPLEENLTSRRSTKHKHNPSASTFRDSAISLATSARASTTKSPDPSDRPTSFLHTRNDSSSTLYNPHTPRTATESRLSLADADPASTLFDRVAHAQRTSLLRPSSPSFTDSPPKHAPPAVDDNDSLAAIRARLASPAVPRKSSKRHSDTPYAVLDDDPDMVTIPLTSAPPPLNPLTLHPIPPRPLSVTSANAPRPAKPYGALAAKGRASPGIGAGEWMGGAPSTRVVSRSGVDLADAPMQAYDDWEEAGRRRASGKMAEEGRMGARRRTSGWRG